MDDPLMLGSGEIWPFLGIIDDVGIFNKALSADDIVDIMDNGLGSATGVAAVEPTLKVTTTWASIKYALE